MKHRPHVQVCKGRHYYYIRARGHRVSAPMPECHDLETAGKHAAEVTAIVTRLAINGCEAHVPDVARRAAAQKPGDLAIVWRLVDGIIADSAVHAAARARHPESLLDEVSELDARSLLDSGPLVYFIVDSFGHVKIGRARDIYVRLAMIQNAHALPVRLIAVRAGERRVERELHQRFEKYRLRGEWFRAGLELVEYILSLRGASS